MTLPDFARKPWAVHEDAFGEETAIVVDDAEYRLTGGAVSTQIVETVGQAGEEYYDRAIAAHIVQLHNEWLQRNVAGPKCDEWCCGELGEHTTACIVRRKVEGA